MTNTVTVTLNRRDAADALTALRHYTAVLDFGSPEWDANVRVANAINLALAAPVLDIGAFERFWERNKHLGFKDARNAFRDQLALEIKAEAEVMAETGQEPRPALIRKDGKSALSRGDRIWMAPGADTLTFAYVTDDGQIATQELGETVTVHPFMPDAYEVVDSSSPFHPSNRGLDGPGGAE